MRPILRHIAPLLTLCLLVACEPPGAESPLGTLEPGLSLAVPGAYPTIQAAVNAASPGDTVAVAPGTYFENVQMKSGVSVVAVGPQQTVLSGQFRLTGAQGCTIEGFLVSRLNASGLSPNAGFVGPPGGHTIRGNTIQVFDVGIQLTGAGAATIERNIVTNSNQAGIRLTNVGAVRVVNNVIRHNKKGGVEVKGPGAVVVLHDTFVGNGFSGSLASGGAAFFADTAGSATLQNNVITGNNGGVNVLAGPNAGHHHNLVWGNVTDFANEASAGPGSLSLDPQFASASNKDFRLLQASPAIDAGVATDVSADFDGLPRPAGAGPDLGAHEHQPPAQAGELLISEVMSNPLDEPTGEYVELFNPTGAPIDAAGLVIDDGDASDLLLPFVAGGPTTVPAGGYAVVLDRDYPAAKPPYSIPAGALLLTVPNGAIGSGLANSDPIRLSRNGSVVATYSHPFDAGNGTSVERVSPDAPDVAASWVASPCGSSPGAPNCASQGGTPKAPTLAITEVMASPVDSSTGEFIEVYNHGTAPVELAGLVISDGDSEDVLIPLAGRLSVVAPGAWALIVDPDLPPAGGPYDLSSVKAVVTVGGAALGNGLAKDDPVTLMAADGQTVLSSFSYPMALVARSVERTHPLAPDTVASWVASPCEAGHSAGKGTCGGPQAAPTLAINEVFANPLDEDTGELVELLNTGTKPVDASGLVLTDGDAVDTLAPWAPGGSTVVPPGGFALVLDAEYAGQYPLPAAAVLLRTGDTTLGNGLATNDPITLLAADGVTVLSTFSFPFNPGNGVSVERVGNTGDVEQNWVASPCVSGSSAGLVNCASPSAPGPAQAASIVVSEVMANPLVESTGEFVELTNVGDAAVDLAGFVLSDGDATDALIGYKGGPTLLAPGGRAVVLDPDYPSGTYALGSAVLLTTGDKTIGSGLAQDDPITVLAADGVTILSTFHHPFATKDGVSAERVDLSAADEAGNWVPSSCPSGSSPGAVNCAAGEPVPSGVTAVDVNTASAAALQQVTGIGPATAAKIIAYRDASGPYEAMEQLTVSDGITLAQVQDWVVAADGEAAAVLSIAAPRPVQVFEGVSQLKDSLPLPSDPSAAAWSGAVVRVRRAVMLKTNDTTTKQTALFGSWGWEGAYEPEGDDQLPVYLAPAPGGGAYSRDQTDHANAMADWAKEDGDPYLPPAFYRWGSPLASGGLIRYANVYTLQGVLEVYQGDWQLRVRARADAGVDRVVLIERWIPAEDWHKLLIIWAYGYKPVSVEATGGYTYGLPYRLGLAHPARTWWADTTGQLLSMPQCTGAWECSADDGSWGKFNEALTAWKATLP